MSRESSRQYIIELDDGTYLYRKGHFSQVAGRSEIEGESWLITDFPADVKNTISRVTTVETGPKYANIMVGKKLQEEGEFDEPVQVISHSLRKKGRYATEVFYTALPVGLFHQFQDRVGDHSDIFHIFPLYTVLLQISRKISGNQTVALIFRHGRYADLLIASKKTVYYANRATVFDQSEEQVQSLWDIIDTDIATVEREQRLSINQCVICNWFDAPDKPDWPERPDRSIVETPSTHITVDDESKTCSLLPMLDLLSASDSVSPTHTKINSYAKRWLPVFQIVLIILAVGLLAGVSLLKTKTDSLKEEVTVAKQQLVNLTNFSLTKKADYTEPLELLKKLDRYRLSKTFKNVINDLSAAVSNQMIIEQVKADVQDDAMNVQIRGTIHAGFQVAYQDYQRLIQNIEQNNYEIVESVFNTEIDQAEFLLVYTSPMGGAQ